MSLRGLLDFTTSGSKYDCVMPFFISCKMISFEYINQSGISCSILFFRANCLHIIVAGSHNILLQLVVINLYLDFPCIIAHIIHTMIFLLSGRCIYFFDSRYPFCCKYLNSWVLSSLLQEKIAWLLYQQRQQVKLFRWQGLTLMIWT